jgi:DNA-directed RNA polymerase subunit alpha
MPILSETELFSITQSTGDERKKTFVLEPLLPGYGITVANALRRVLLSSLVGSAVTSVKIEGVSHEFATIPHIKEDVLEIILNLKSMRVKLDGDDPVTLRLEVKGPKEVSAADFAKNAQVTIVDSSHQIATVGKGGKLTLEVTIEKGRGFVPTEIREREKVTLGTILVDAAFSPVKKVSYNVENTRVGRMTNFDKITMDVTTDGTVDPSQALHDAAQILVDHFQRISEFGVVPVSAQKEASSEAKAPRERKKAATKKAKPAKSVKPKSKAKPKKAAKPKKVAKKKKPARPGK